VNSTSRTQGHGKSSKSHPSLTYLRPAK